MLWRVTRTEGSRQRAVPILWSIAFFAFPAFALNLLWELAQCRIFFVHGTVAPTFGAMIMATTGDVVLLVVAYFVVACIRRDLSWTLGSWGFQVWLAMELTAIGEAVVVEGAGLAAHRWSYTDAAPIVPGTGISFVPILQLAILAPLSFALAKRLFRLGAQKAQIMHQNSRWKF